MRWFALLTRNRRVGGASPARYRAPRQGILLTVVSLGPRVVNGYRQESIPYLQCAPKLQVAGQSRVIIMNYL